MSEIRPVWGRPPIDAARLPLNGRVEADVAIIGAGFAGLVAAFELAAAGRDVIVLDAGDLSASASAASAGQVGPLFYGAHKDPASVMAKLGEEAGVRLNRAVAASGRWLFDLIADQGIACDARPGFVCAFRTDKSVAKAAERFEQWQAYGGRAQRLSRDELAAFTTSSRYAGGFMLPDGGLLDPVALLDGLASAARKAGARIHLNSPVVAVGGSEGSWTLRTAAAEVTSRHLLVATGSAGLPDRPELARSVWPVACGIAATAPLPDRGASLLPQGGPVADLDDAAIFSPAITAGGRLVLSFLMSGRADPLTSSAPTRRRLRRAYPGHQAVSFERASAGRLALTPDGLPRLFRTTDGMIAVSGCNGFGLTLGILAAREAVRLILGTPPAELALPVTAPRALPGGGLMPAIFRNLIVPFANRVGA